MKKLILKASALSLLILFIVVFLNPFFSKVESNSFKTTINQLYNSEKDSIDILIFGSSHAMNSYNPQIIDKTLNTYSFNLGSAAQKLVTTKYLIEESIKLTNPKIVILDLFEFSGTKPKTDEVEGFQFLVYNSTKHTMNKFSTVYSNYGLKKALSVNFPTIRNHNKWSELKTTSFSKNETLRGFVPLAGEIIKEEKNKYKDFYVKNYDDNKLRFSSIDLKNDEKSLIFDIYKMLSDRGIELVIVSAPYISYFYSKESFIYHFNLKKLSDSLNVNYLDFNEYFNALDLDFKDFKESSHVNINGSNKLSAYLSKYLAETTSLKIKDDSYINEFLKTIKPRTHDDNKTKIESANRGLSQIILKKGVFLEKKHDFADGIQTNKIVLYSDNFKRYIGFESQEPLEETYFYDKVFGIQGIPYNKDLDRLPNWVIEKKGDRTTWRGEPKVIKIKEKNYFLMELPRNCDIDEWKQLRLFLMDKEEYKGAIGNILEIDDIMFSLPDGITLKDQRKLIRERESPLNEILKKGTYLRQKHQFSEELIINELILYSNNINRFLAIPYLDVFEKDYLKDKAFSIQGVAYDKDLERLPNWVVEKKGNITTWKGEPIKEKINGKDYFLIELPKNCDIEKWKQLRLFLINKDEYKGVIGNVLEISDAKF